MSHVQSEHITRLLHDAAKDDRAAADELLSLVYDQLRQIAHQRMAQERAGHTLQSTALVHEAYLRLTGDSQVQWSGRGHFFAAAAEAMRRILVEHARARGRVKRGGQGGSDAVGGHAPSRRVPLNVADLADEHDPEQILMLDDEICRLETEDPQAARIVRLRFYAGLSNDETAEALGVSPSTVDREWAFARAWLYRRLRESV